MMVISFRGDFKGTSSLLEVTAEAINESAQASS